MYRGGGFHTQIPSLSSFLNSMAVEITNENKPVTHKAATQHDKIGIRVANLNVGTLRGGAGEIAETLSRRREDYAVCKKQGGGVVLQEWSQVKMMGANYFG